MDRRGFLLSASAVIAQLGCSRAEEELAATAARLALEGQICGVSVATFKGGKNARALSVSGCGTEPGSDAVFQAASLSKPVVACLVLRMAQRGRLSLDEPISEVLPGGYAHRQNIFALNAAPVVDQVPADVLRRLTPRMLLSHSAGFPNWSSSGPLTVSFAPGTRWQYSGEGYVLLQHVLETITKLPLQQLAESELFAPMGLTGTAFRLTDSILPRLVSGSPRQLRFPYEIGASSLYASASDYARFIATVMNDEAMLSLTVRDPVMLPQSPGRGARSTHLAWGLGWGIEWRDGPVSIWHWGNNPGFRSLALADLRSRDAVVVLTSSEKGMPLAKALVSAAMPGEHPALDFDLVR